MPNVAFVLTLSLLADHLVREGGDEEKQHLRTDCGSDNLVKCNEHSGVEQKGGAGSRASH